MQCNSEGLEFAPFIRSKKTRELLPHLLPARSRRDTSDPKRVHASCKGGLADVAADALRMLKHAQPGLHLPRLDLLVNWILHPEPPAIGCENNPPVRDVY